MTGACSKGLRVAPHPPPASRDHFFKKRTTMRSVTHDPIDNPTEAIMSDTTTTLRYGYEPKVAFAATRAGAARRAREAAIAATSASSRPGPAPHLLRRLFALFTASTDR